jgi:hypothetical protein
LPRGQIQNGRLAAILNFQKWGVTSNRPTYL